MEQENELEDKGLETAPQFRKKKKLDDQKYMRTWLLGCHFPWLNPRKKKAKKKQRKTAFRQIKSG